MKHIRNLIVILAIALPLLFSSSCSKESNYKNRIVGRWVVTSYSGSIYDENELLYSCSDYNMGYTGSLFDLSSNIGRIIEFTSNGYLIVDDVYKGSYTINDENITIYQLNSSIETYSIEKLLSSSLLLTHSKPRTAVSIPDENHQYIGYYNVSLIERFEFDKLGSEK